MEAQIKPSTGWQATVRMHHMVQSRTVNVHRILAANTIEEHLVKLIEKLPTCLEPIRMKAPQNTQARWPQTQVRPRFNAS